MTQKVITRRVAVITHSSASMATGRYEATQLDRYNAGRLTGRYRAIVDAEWAKVAVIRETNRAAGLPEKSGLDYALAHERVQAVWREQRDAKLQRTIARKDKILAALPPLYELRSSADRARHFARQLNAPSTF